MAGGLEGTRVAAGARKARCTAGRRSLQRVVLRASEARNMIIQRQANEIARAKAIAERAEKAQRTRKLSMRKLRLGEGGF